jgi:hypothetical protein
LFLYYLCIKMGDRMEGGKGAENHNLFNKVDKGRES